jgi:sec-independent protein translocase protein TatC
LAGMRKYAVVLILLVAALVTPPDIMSQMILFFAVYPLYEVSIFLIRRIEKRREAELRAEGLWDEETDGDQEPKA